MKLLQAVLVLLLIWGSDLYQRAEAGGIAKTLSRSAIKRLFRQESVRDAATLAKPLTKPRTVYRYTSRERAEQEVQQGLAPGRHMTSAARPGRPLSAESAQRRYGLMDKPDVRETIRLQRGFLVRHNRVWGGDPGVGEITSSQKVPPRAITFAPLKQAGTAFKRR